MSTDHTLPPTYPDDAEDDIFPAHVMAQLSDLWGRGEARADAAERAAHEAEQHERAYRYDGEAVRV
jgi:hypothetical protein